MVAFQRITVRKLRITDYVFRFTCFSTSAFRAAMEQWSIGIVQRATPTLHDSKTLSVVVLVVDALTVLHRHDVGTVEREGALAAGGDESVKNQRCVAQIVLAAERRSPVTTDRMLNKQNVWATRPQELTPATI